MAFGRGIAAGAPIAGMGAMTTLERKPAEHGNTRPAWPGGLPALVLFALLAFFSWCVQGQPAVPPAPAALVVTLDSAIGPVASRQVGLGLQQAVRDGAGVVVLQMDTPGGLDTSMREIVRAVLTSPIPVLAFVGPSGARAASAGTFILYASHLAAMAPGTNLGAAMPVPLGGGAPSRGGEGGASDAPVGPEKGGAQGKAVNDAVAYIRSLAELRGRNADWAEQAVREAASLPAQAALAQGVINLVAADVPALLQQVDGREVQVGGRSQRLQTAGLEVRHAQVDWRSRVLGVLTNPNLALLLLMVGFCGLLSEFMAPGALVPGVVGAIALVLGLYALSVMPLNLAGMALLLLGLSLLAAEAFAPSFGILGLGGVLALVLGAGMLIDEGDVGLLQPSIPLVAGMGLAALAFSMLVLRLAVRNRGLRSHSGAEALIGETARVLDWSASSGQGHVLLAGERWQARGQVALRPGEQVRVLAVQGLHVMVGAGEPAPADPPFPSPTV